MKVLIAGVATVTMAVSLALLPAAAHAAEPADCFSVSQEFADHYRVTKNVPADAEMAAVCTSSAVTVWAELPDGTRLEPESAPIPTSESSEAPSNQGQILTEGQNQALSTESEEPLPAEPWTCVIISVYAADCNYREPYLRHNPTTGEIIWQRSISLYVKFDLQQLNQLVSFRITSDDGIPITAHGELDLYRMHNILSPTLEQEKPFLFLTPQNQLIRTSWLSRADKTEGKYSIAFHLDSIYDSEDDIVFAFNGYIGSSPRFQCYQYVGPAYSKNCAWPNKQEVGIWP
ncbi:hypothetical protein J7E29_05670 [Streptomyces sp. ISL-90]|nr:hypothetical protein [Streptomyces sp. ISL-90]